MACHHRYNQSSVRQEVTAMAQGSPIHINPAHKGVFTAKAVAAGMSVQGYAAKVLNAPKGQFSSATREQANFAHNEKGFNHSHHKA
jgi:hypothetical protein